MRGSPERFAWQDQEGRRAPHSWQRARARERRVKAALLTGVAALAALLASVALPLRVPSSHGVEPAGARLPAGTTPSRPALQHRPDLAAQLLAAVNADRARQGLPLLRPLHRLAAAGAANNQRMAGQGRATRDPGLGARLGPVRAWSHEVACAPTLEEGLRGLRGSLAYRMGVARREFNAAGVAVTAGGCLWVTVVLAAVPASAFPGGGTATSVPTTTTTAPASPPPPPSGQGSVAQRITQELLTRLNAERRARGLQPLTWDENLARMAREWSGEMARTKVFQHRDLGEALGWPELARYSALGENIATVAGYPDYALQLHLGWMRSEGHRRSILQPGFDAVGIGVVCEDGQVWATQNFGRLDGSARPPLSSATPPEEPIVATRHDGLRC